MSKQELLPRELQQSEFSRANSDLVNVLKSMDDKLSKLIPQNEDTQHLEMLELDQFEMLPSEAEIDKMSAKELASVLEQAEGHHFRRHHRHMREAVTMPRSSRFRRAMQRMSTLDGAPSFKEVAAMGVGSAIAAPVLAYVATKNPLNGDPNWPFYADLIMMIASYGGAVALRKHKHARLTLLGAAVYETGALIDMAMQLGTLQGNASVFSLVTG